jgi:hypothetical protein
MRTVTSRAWTSTRRSDIKNHLAWVDVEDQLANGNMGAAPVRTNRGKDWAIIWSPEFTPFKGLDLKPMFSYFTADGTTSGSSRRNAFNVRTVGGTMNGAGAFASSSVVAGLGTTTSGDASKAENRYTAGFDGRWRVGAFGLDPTIAYQWGNYQTQAFRTNGSVGWVRGDTSAWLFDTIASYQLGPLLLEARGMYSTGNKARDNLSEAKRYFEPLDLDTGYWSGGWLGIMGLGVDYFNGGSGAMQGLDTNVGYDRYGRGQFALRATYSITPAWAVYGVVSPGWAAEAVSTHTSCPALSVSTSALGCTSRVAIDSQSFAKGDHNYLGTEINGGITWRFAPNVAFDLAAYYLFAGSALNQTELLNGQAVARDSRDGYYAAARVRLSF